MARVQTWHGYNFTQLLLQGHDVFAQLNIVHPEERQEDFLRKEVGLGNVIIKL